MNLGDEFPNFKAKTTQGDIDFHEWIGETWAVFFSHPAGLLLNKIEIVWNEKFVVPDFTPVCTTELSRAASMVPDFQKRNA